MSGPALLFKLPANEPVDAGSVVAIVVNMGGAEVVLEHVIRHSGLCDVAAAPPDKVAQINCSMSLQTVNRRYPNMPAISTYE